MPHRDSPKFDFGGRLEAADGRARGVSEAFPIEVGDSMSRRSSGREAFEEAHGCAPGHRRPSRSPRARVRAVLALLACAAWASGASAQSPGSASAPIEASRAAAERAAEEAAAAAVEARALADRLAAEAERIAVREAEAARRAEAARVAEGGESAPAGSPPVPSEIAGAVARAEAAAERAAAAARVVADAQRDARRAHRRPGPYVGAAFLYGAENFDDNIIVKSSTGGAAFLGYRISSVFAAELRYEGFEGFDLEASNGRGEIDGFALTASAKIYPFSGRLQPFAAVGLGGVRFEQRNVFSDGSRSRSQESDVAFRFGGGLDAWLSEDVVLNLEAAYLGPVDDLTNLEITILSIGLTYRF